MSRLSRAALVALVLGAASGALGACQALAGIEDRTYVPGDGGDADAAPSQQCKSYCELAKSLCLSPNQLYANNDVCLHTCALMDPGDVNEPAGNTVACRANQLQLAQSTNEPGTLPDYCAKAGPGGNNGPCGSNCESYCQLYALACKADQSQLTDAQYDQKKCVAKCAGLADTGTFDSTINHGGDTVQCRLVHTSTSTVNPTEHCVHAQLQAQGQATPPGPCLDDASVTQPDCDSYCKLETTECQGANQIYESVSQCKAVCQALPLGSITDIKENSIGCRKYHSYNALVDPDTHCSHTGPGGDGHCGSSAAAGTSAVTGNCESYCILLEQACGAGVAGLAAPATFQGNFKNQAACQKACGSLDGAGPNSHYTVAPLPAGNTVQCRLLHVSRALSLPIVECSAALGGAPCD